MASECLIICICQLREEKLAPANVHVVYVVCPCLPGVVT